MKKRNLLVKAWKGEAYLWQAWLLIGLAAILIVKVILPIIEVGIYSASESLGWPAFVSECCSYALFAIAWAIQIAWWRMVWICSANPTKTVWTTIAKIFIVIAILSSVGNLMSNLSTK